MRNLLWLAAAGAAIFLISKYRFGQKAVFLLRGIKPSGTLLKPTLDVDISVQNPTNQSITIKSITGDLSVNNRYVANVSAFGDQEVQPNSENILKLVARPSAIGIIQSVIAIIRNKENKFTASFNGTANVNGLVVPINENQSF